MKKNQIKIISFVIFLVAMVLLTVIALPLFKAFDQPDEFKAWIDGLGAWGILIMFFVQVFQIVVALIPGEVVETLSGVLYGWFGGFVFCMVGIAIGQTLVYKAVRVWGSDFVEKVAGSKAMNKFKFLQDESKLKLILFFLFFIPGTPKDLLTYIVPLTKIKFRDFLVITLVARIPSVISSTYGGSALAEQNFWKAAIIYGGIAIFSLIGVIIYRIWDKKRMTK